MEYWNDGMMETEVFYQEIRKQGGEEKTSADYADFRRAEKFY